ncbi:RelA/SpoT domain protein [Pseudomonas syringae pv. spinaceae]|uniref:RelA/SpoT domain protein n=1 Tax=Pseudomonas syringae pv. spinaceae TaxID=264459 RepID=A0A0Q0CWB6_PSESX|nr:RelA/SpoT domain-containing protein [Pseudomonas syringae]KPY98153.1 RelA/SpoT domain protein [Pseudomonas syringae pv. spinaceae]RMT28178.1 RelA/SpoT domain protein [Pseudomonas syringae pv. spinaceae]
MPSMDFEVEKQNFCDYYNGNHGLLDGAKNSFITLVNSLIRSSSDIALSKIEGRVKDRDKCVKKFIEKYKVGLESSAQDYQILDHITDLIGVRVVCLYEDDIEKIKELLSDHFKVIDITDKIAQIENTENSFGYKGLHLDLELNEKRKELPEYSQFVNLGFEVQVRTIIQDSWSVLDHKIKYKKSIPINLKRRINSLAALFEVADREFREIRNATVEGMKAEDIPQEQISRESDQIESGELYPKITPSSLNAFSFLKIAHHFFNEFEFEARKVDGFTEEVVSLEPDLSRGKFNFYMRENISKVKRYKEFFEKNYPSYKFDPYTVIRHCLYLGEKDLFERLLTAQHSEVFDAWLANNS